MGRLALLALLTAAIAACAPRTRPQPPPLPEPEEAPEAVELGRLPPDETRNRVAVLVPLAGDNAALGQSILNAANLALFDTGGQRIRITAYDTSRGAALAANEALVDGSGLILGPLLAEDVRGVAPMAQRAGVPVVAFSNDIGVAGESVYIMGFNPGQAIDRVVAFARSREARRFGALIPNNVYGERASQALVLAVESAGGLLAGSQRYDRSTASVRAAATRLHDAGRYDAVLIADAPQAALQAVPIVRQASPQPRILGTELWASETGLGARPVSARMSACAANQAPTDANYGAFRSRYRARYNASPFRMSTLGYDAVLLAVRIAADWPVGRRFPARALTDPGGFAGVDGAFRFGRDGVAERALEVREVTASGATVVSPAPREFD